MRKLRLAMLGLLISCGALGQMTVKEYNYVSKGYDYQLGMGLEIKKGITVKTDEVADFLFSSTIMQVHLEFFYRDGEKTPFATLMRFNYGTGITLGDVQYKYSICIPNMKSSGEILTLHQADLKKIKNKLAYKDYWKADFAAGTAYKITTLYSQPEPIRFKFKGELKEVEPPIEE